MRTAPATPILRWAIVASWMIPALLLATTLGAVVATYSPLPIQDEWDTVWWWRDIQQHGLTLSYLSSQHNEHRIPFSRLVSLADLQWLGGREVLPLVVIGLVQLCGVGCLAAMARRRPLSATGVLGLALAAGLLACLVQWQNFSWGFQVSFVGVYAAGAWSLYLFSLGGEAPDRLSWARLALAVALLAVATYCMANGLFVGVAAALVALAARRWRVALVALAATGLLTVLYLHDYHAVALHSPAALALSEPARALQYVLVYLGGAWAFGHRAIALAAGGAGVVLTAFAAWATIRDRTQDAGADALFGLMLFLGVTAGVTALGRLSFGLDQALASRYATPSCWFWAAQALYWGLRAQGTRYGVTAGAALLAGLLLLVPLQLRSLVGFYQSRIGALYGASALLGGLDDERAWLQLYPDPARIRDLAPLLRQRRMSLFAGQEPYVAGAIAPPAATTGCLGAFDTLDPPAVAGGPRMALGWGWDRERRRAFDRVLVVDEAGRVAGLGLGGGIRLDVRKAVARVRTLRSGWVASVQPGQARTLVAYGLRPDGGACVLGRKAVAP